jgi:hypothetical protein
MVQVSLRILGFSGQVTLSGAAAAIAADRVRRKNR